MTVCVRAGFDKVLPAQAMECADKTGRHGMVHGPNRSPWRVRNRLHAGSGRFPRPVWRLETPTVSRLPVRFRAGILRASLMRPQSAGFRNGVRRASGAPDAGSSSSHAVGAPVNTPSRARDGVAHPPSSGRSSLSRRVRLLPQSAGVTAETADPRVVGTVSGVVHGRPVESCSEASGYSRRIAVRDGMTGAGPVGVFRRIRVAGAPHRHAATGLRRDAGPGAPGLPQTYPEWMVAYAGSGTPGRRPAGVTAARPPCGGRSGFESRGGRRRPYDPLSDDPIRAVGVPPSDDGTLTALFHELFSAGYRDACRRG